MGLELTVQLPDGSSVTRTTSEQGAITVPLEGRMQGQATVSVTDLTGKKQPTCTLDLERCHTAVVIRSPKVLVPVRAELHKGEPAKPAASSPNPKTTAKPTTTASPADAHAAEPWWVHAVDQAKEWLNPLIGDLPLHPRAHPVAPPLVAQGRNLEGHPVSVAVGPECPNKDGLRLGYNNRYRQAILDAGKRLGIDPRAVATLIDAESSPEPEKIALTGKDGKPLLDKKGKPRELIVGTHWKVDSAASTSGARGLTQFVPATWLGMAMKPGTYLHERCKEAGWVFQADVTTTTHGKPTTHKQWQFKLADGSSTFDPAPRGNPKRSFGDANIQACLALRDDATCSIITAADYGVENLALISRSGFNMAGLTDAEKAKLMYLMHHEGSSGIKFLNNTATYTAGQLIGQTKERRASEWIAAVMKDDDKETNNDQPRHWTSATLAQTTKAYRSWLTDFIFLKIDLNGFACVQNLDIPSLQAIFKKISAASLEVVKLNSQ